VKKIDPRIGGLIVCLAGSLIMNRYDNFIAYIGMVISIIGLSIILRFHLKKKEMLK